MDELPRTLDETYERILLEIDEEKHEYAIRLFRCLAFSRRPLHVNELAEVFAVELDVGGIPRLNVNLRPGDANGAVLSTCSTLIAITPDISDDSAHIVQFSHYSVKEFLTSERLAKSDKGDLCQYYISPKPAHTILAQTCLGTLLQPDIHIQDIIDNFPLINYAAQNWFHHARCDGVASQIQDGMERLFDPDRKHFAVWVSLHDIEDNSRVYRSPNPPEPSPLYYATLCGFASLVKYLITTCRQDPNKSHGGLHAETPVHAAVFLRHTAIAQFLLEHTADVNARDSCNSTPLHKASEGGNYETVQLLLSHRADVHVLDYWGYSPLQRAFQYQKFDAMKLLVNVGGDVNVRNGFNSTLLHKASGIGNLDVMQFLLSHDADVNVLDHWGDYPLHKAFRYHDAVELLVSRGVDVNIRNMSHSTPLHEASGIGILDVMQLLLSRGADINVLDHWGDSPLHRAFRNHNAVKLLVNGGADVKVQNKFDLTPLHEASGIGNLDVMQLLLNHGADVNAQDHRGGSPLHRAF